MPKKQKKSRAAKRSTAHAASNKSAAVVAKQAKPSAPTPGILKPKAGEPTGSYVVRGTVESTEGKPVSGAVVQAAENVAMALVAYEFIK